MIGSGSSPKNGRPPEIILKLEATHLFTDVPAAIMLEQQVLSMDLESRGFRHKHFEKLPLKVVLHCTCFKTGWPLKYSPVVRYSPVAHAFKIITFSALTIVRSFFCLYSSNMLCTKLRYSRVIATFEMLFKLLNLVIPDAAPTGKSQVESTCEDWEMDKYKEEKKWKKTGCKVHLS